MNYRTTVATAAHEPVGLRLTGPANAPTWSYTCACLFRAEAPDRQAVVRAAAQHRLGCYTIPAPPRRS